MSVSTKRYAVQKTGPHRKEMPFCTDYNGTKTSLQQMMTPPSVYRYENSQRNRTLNHPSLPQPTPEDEESHRQSILKKSVESDISLQSRLEAALGKSIPSGISGEMSPTSTLNFSSSHNSIPIKKMSSEMHRHSAKHSFVVCADTQIGMTSQNSEWETELEYSRRAISLINSLHPKPAFVCMCGDLVDMEYTFHKGSNAQFTKSQCVEIQDQQNRDFKDTWKSLNDDIALVCLCGNHDVGNRPTKASIDRFRSEFGDEYLSFWTNQTYNIVLNNVLFTDPTGAPDIFEEQLHWLEERLEYANDLGADHIFVFGHHPWFLYDEDETDEDLKGVIPYPEEWGESPPDAVFHDAYFSISKKYRMIALDLFKKHGVSASFSGHFHQNLVSKTSWGMDMIITAPLSMLFESTGNETMKEGNARGVRIVEVEENTFCHDFITL